MRRLLLISLAVASLSACAVSAAPATTLTATATVTGAGTVSVGLLSGPTPRGILTGTDQVVTYAPALGIVDARGTGGGWNLTVAATPFSDGTGHTVAAGSIRSVAQICRSGSTCTRAASSGFTYPLTLAATANRFFSAAASTGLGKIDVTPTISIAVPANAFARTYSCTLTIAAAAGP